MAVQVGHRVAWLACDMRAGVLHANYTRILCGGGRRTTNAAGGLLLSTMCRRPHLDVRDELVVIRVDEQDVKKPVVERQKPTSP